MSDKKPERMTFGAKCGKCGKDVWDANDKKDRERAEQEFSEDKGICRHCKQEHIIVSVGKTGYRLIPK